MRLVLVVCALVCVCALFPTLSSAVQTKTWEQASMEDFDQGMLQHLSLSSDGRLAVAPRVKELYDSSLAVLWAVARDSKGTIYAGGGSLGESRAKLFAIDFQGAAQGRGKLLAELDGIAVQAIAIDRQDRVYAATSPDGKVYRVDSSGKADVFYDPKTKYIWALAFAKNGDLYVATGDRGEIHRVTPAGAGSVFFRTEEAHARSLTVDAADNVIVGTEPSGLILRVSPAGQGFVLYQAPKREITAVAVGTDGAIYAAGAGNRAATPASPPTAVGAAPQPTAPVPAPPGTVQIVAPNPTPVALPILASQAVTGGSEIYRIQADGYPRRIWSHGQDLVYALAFDAQGRLLAGTGNRGNLYRIDSDYSYTRLLNLDPTQITGLLRGPEDRIYAVTGNIGKVVAIGPEPEASGIFESDVLDAGGFSYWGRVHKEPETPAGTTFETRSGNVGRAQRNWSAWAPLNQGRVMSPPARFLQYRATVSGNSELSDVGIAYQMKNVAPVVAQVEITPPNYRFPAPLGLGTTTGTAATPTLTLQPIQRRPVPAQGISADPGNTPALTWTKGQIGARWVADDDNGDTLQFKVEIRGVNETGWKLVRDKVRERYLSWDSTAYSDGKYVLRVTASDAPSNPPDEALTGLRESDPFLIDNTPPEITCCKVSSSPAVTVQFHAKDALSTLAKAEYSVNGGDWIVVEPTTRLTDSNEHDYRIALANRPPGEVTVAVRVEDTYGNQAVAKTVLK
ncbi:MAG: repeat protein [Bryobacterales bacterium]|nr:repeat protein [Bryobacterales bacterium]